VRPAAVLASICLLVAAVTLAGCGGKGGGNARSSSRTTLTIYSSLPLQGPAEAQSEAVVNAEKLALAEVGGRVGRFTIKYVALDDATAAANGSDPGQTSVDARKAAQDASTIAYLGEGRDGSSAVSIPILNEAGILQVSPLDTPAGFTRHQGADKGEPERYYPTGKRTFARVVPPDNVQAAAQASYQLKQGCATTFVVVDGGVFGAGLSGQFTLAAKAKGPAIVKRATFPHGATNTKAVARQVASSGANCVLYAGAADDSAVEIFKAVHAVDPAVKLFAASAVADTSFAHALPASVQRVTYVTSPDVDPRLYPPAGRDFVSTYRQKFGKAPELGAIFGYEAMKVTLLAIQNAGDRGNDPAAVINAIFQIKDRDSPLGKYSIDENGDTTLSDYGAYRVENGQLTFDMLLKIDA
jgi:branched-chain amino acid transport system substrate-binding protein